MCIELCNVFLPPGVDCGVIAARVGAIGEHVRGHVVRLYRGTLDGIHNIAQRIQQCIYERRHIFFFMAANLYAIVGFPHLFVATIPLGIVFGFLCSQAARGLGLNRDFYLCRDALEGGTLIQSTLGTLNIIGKAILLLNNYRFGVAQEGVISSLASGVVAGVYVHSVIAYVVDSIAARVF